MMKWQIEHGQVISETVYTRAIHQLSPSWDIRDHDRITACRTKEKIRSLHGHN